LITSKNCICFILLYDEKPRENCSPSSKCPQYFFKNESNAKRTAVPAMKALTVKEDTSKALIRRRKRILF
jgi:hypothetical protein